MTPSDPDASETEASEQPAPPVHVRYVGGHHLPSPVEIAGRFWHSGTYHLVSAEHAAELLAREGFHKVAPRRP